MPVASDSTAVAVFLYEQCCCCLTKKICLVIVFVTSKIYNLQCCVYMLWESYQAKDQYIQTKKKLRKPLRIIHWPRFFLLPYKTKKTPTTKKGCCFLWALYTTTHDHTWTWGGNLFWCGDLFFKSDWFWLFKWTRHKNVKNLEWNFIFM